MMKTGAMAVAVMLTAAGAAQAQDGATSACARLAPQLKMKQAAAREGGTAGEWRVDLLGGIGKALFGGSAASSMSIEPVADADAIDYSTYRSACVRERIDVTCKASGPARLIVATDKMEAGVDLATGETVDAGIRKGRHVYCRDIR